MEKDYSKLHFVNFFVQKKVERNRNLRRAVRRDVHRDVTKMNPSPHGNPATREDAVYLPHNYEAGQSYTNGDHIWTCL